MLEIVSRAREPESRTETVPGPGPGSAASKNPLRTAHGIQLGSRIHARFILPNASASNCFDVGTEFVLHSSGEGAPRQTLICSTAFFKCIQHWYANDEACLFQ